MGQSYLEYSSEHYYFCLGDFSPVLPLLPIFCLQPAFLLAKLPSDERNLPALCHDETLKLLRKRLMD
ncbi:MAG: hypothetical protein JWQ71_1280 [Pedosphaera sp.]|nr:hypothetical protein [Pedosphaera sp.]